MSAPNKPTSKPTAARMQLPAGKKRCPAGYRAEKNADGVATRYCLRITNTQQQIQKAQRAAGGIRKAIGEQRQYCKKKDDKYRSPRNPKGRCITKAEKDHELQRIKLARDAAMAAQKRATKARQKERTAEKQAEAAEKKANKAIQRSHDVAAKAAAKLARAKKRTPEQNAAMKARASKSRYAKKRKALGAKLRSR